MEIPDQVLSIVISGRFNSAWRAGTLDQFILGHVRPQSVRIGEPTHEFRSFLLPLFDHAAVKILNHSKKARARLAWPAWQTANHARTNVQDQEQKAPTSPPPRSLTGVLTAAVRRRL